MIQLNTDAGIGWDSVRSEISERVGEARAGWDACALVEMRKRRARGWLSSLNRSTHPWQTTHGDVRYDMCKTEGLLVCSVAVQWDEHTTV